MKPKTALESTTPAATSNLPVALVTTLGGIIAAIMVARAKAAGVDLAGQELAIQGAATLIVGAAAGWVFSILDSFVAAVVAINNAVANRAGQIVAKMGGL